MNGSGGLPTEYSVTVCRGQVDDRLDIHSVYERVRRITHRIFSDCMQGSGGWPNINSVYEWIRQMTDQIFSDCMNGSGRLPTKYSVTGWMGQADYRLNIRWLYGGVRQITTRYSFVINGPGGLPTRYLFGVWMGQVDYLSDIQWLYRWVRRITDWIFSDCMTGSGGLPIGYSVTVCRGQANTCWIFSDCMNGSGGLPTRYSFGVWNGSGGLPIRYSVTVWMGQVDYLSDIQWLYEWVRWIT